MSEKVAVALGGLLVIASGAFSLLAAIFNWNWFFRASKSALICKLFGRTGARIFYGLLGALLFAGGLWFMVTGLL